MKSRDQSHHYFTEVQPLIARQFRSVVSIVFVLFGIELLLGGVSGAIFFYAEKELSNQVIMRIMLALTSLLGLVLMYRIRSLLKANHIKHATQLFILTVPTLTAALVWVGGGMAGIAILALPLVIVLSGFFANKKIMFVVTTLLSGFIVFLYCLGLAGFPPLVSPTGNYFTTMQMLNLLLALFGCFALVSMVIGSFSEIQEQLVTENQKANFLAKYDALTKLPNRYYFETHFSTFYQNELGNNEKNFLLFVDIDNFKSINTRYGHKGGDHLLQATATRLQDLCSYFNALLCRIGGDEFVIMLRAEQHSAEKILTTINSEFARPIEMDNEQIHIRCSVGITDKVTSSSSAESYRQADIALSRAKKLGKNTHVFYQKSFGLEEIAETKLLEDLQKGIELQQFFLTYQPIINLQTGMILGAEALIRWRNSDGAIILPDAFIDHAEKYSLIDKLTQWVLKQAAHDCAAWHEAGFQKLFVAVNVSATLVEKMKLSSYVKSALSSSTLDGQFLELELTESTLLQKNQIVLSELDRLKQQGIRLAIDDFGTKYSNLSYLGELEVDKLKIDRSLVAKAQISSSRSTLVQAICSIAASFNLDTVAEGIETKPLMNKMRKFGCTAGQGYLWSKPKPQKEFLDFLHNYNKDLTTCF